MFCRQRKAMLAVFTILLTAGPYCAAAYDLVRDYSGSTFFDRWDFFGNWDNLTNGDVWWLSKDDAFNQGLAYMNDAGHAILKVDNASEVLLGEKRNSVRITSQDTYAVGSLWVIDVNHIPYGCSVWPAFWTTGLVWPNDGEIDIIESINLMPYNEAALHTTAGCMKGDAPNQSGFTGSTDCSISTGCTVLETKENSLSSGFAAAGGGVWAVQFDVAGIFMWFWSRPDIPEAITHANSTSALMDLSQFGNPSASYPASTCDITQFFTPQNLILDITLCGQWAGIEQLYLPTCAAAGTTGNCYQDNVVGPGSPKYDEAYFDISYIRAYTTGGAAPTPTALPLQQAPSSPFSTVITTPTSSSVAGGYDRDGNGNGAPVHRGEACMRTFVVLLGILAIEQFL